MIARFKRLPPADQHLLLFLVYWIGVSAALITLMFATGPR